jgi:cation transport ATPase
MQRVRDVKASYTTSTATVTYDPQMISSAKIIETIEKLDYKVKNKQNNKSESNGICLFMIWTSHTMKKGE